MTAQPHADAEGDEGDREAHDADVDEASEESFPASDPPSYGAPETGGDRD